MGAGTWLFWQSSLMTVLWSVSVLAQIACIIHVLKTGRPFWWLWIIFGFPLIGLAAYLYLEVRPTWGKVSWHAVLWRLKSRGERIAILQHALEESTTIKNRLALADELHAAGEYDRECALLADGLRGAFKDDPHLLMRLTDAHLEAGRAAEAGQFLAQAIPGSSPDAQLEHALLRARLAIAEGRTAEAETLLKELISKKRSEGPRYYYAELLLQTGRRGEATALLKDILHQYRRGTVVWRHLEKHWFYAARRLLKSAA
jgi:hypothetical protein